MLHWFIARITVNADASSEQIKTGLQGKDICKPLRGRPGWFKKLIHSLFNQRLEILHGGLPQILLREFPHCIESMAQARQAQKFIPADPGRDERLAILLIQE